MSFFSNYSKTPSNNKRISIGPNCSKDTYKARMDFRRKRIVQVPTLFWKQMQQMACFMSASGILLPLVSFVMFTILYNGIDLINNI